MSEHSTGGESSEAMGSDGGRNDDGGPGVGVPILGVVEPDADAVRDDDLDYEHDEAGGDDFFRAPEYLHNLELDTADLNDPAQYDYLFSDDDRAAIDLDHPAAGLLDDEPTRLDHHDPPAVHEHHGRRHDDFDAARFYNNLRAALDDDAEHGIGHGSARRRWDRVTAPRDRDPVVLGRAGLVEGPPERVADWRDTSVQEAEYGWVWSEYRRVRRALGWRDRLTVRRELAAVRASLAIRRALVWIDARI